MSVATHVAPPTSLSLAGEALRAVALRFPPRPAEDNWAATAGTQADILARLQQPPLRPADVRHHRARIRGARQILQWLDTFPGATWQQRWNASPASTRPGNDWARLAPGWIGTAAGPSQRQTLSGGLLSLICADVIRPALPWLLSRTSANMTSLRIGLIPTRDPEGFSQLEAMIEPATWSSNVGRHALHALVKIVVPALGQQLLGRPGTASSGNRLSPPGTRGERGLEAEMPDLSLASTEEKLTQLDAEQVRQRQVIDLGMPRFSQIATRISTARGPSS